MKKIETIWRELLYQALEKGNRRFVQKDLAQKFNFSLSTVFQALKPARGMGAVKVYGRYFILEDPEKLLYHWASFRNFNKELILSGKVDLPILEIEGLMLNEITFGLYAAGRFWLKTPAADYDKVYIYADGAETLKKRFNIQKGRANLFILQADPFLKLYGQKTTLAQTFVDLWNLSDWQAKEYLNAIKEKINELL